MAPLLQWRSVKRPGGVRLVGRVGRREVYAVRFRRVGGGGLGGNESQWDAYLIRGDESVLVGSGWPNGGASGAKLVAERHFAEHIQPGLVARLDSLILAAPTAAECEPADVIPFARAAK